MQVNVTYSGSTIAPNVSNSACAATAGSLNASGAGTISYLCSFENATTATDAVLGFTSVGKIAGVNCQGMSSPLIYGSKAGKSYTR